MSKVHVLHIDTIKHIDKDGNTLWEDHNIHNILHDEGEQAILSAYFATALSGYGAPPSNLYLGLDARASLNETDTLTSLSGEPSGNGYARQALSTAGTGVSGQDFYITQPAAYYQAQSKTVTFTCSTSAWSGVTKLFLCTAAAGTTGKLICSLALSTTRTLQVGDSLQASMYIGLSE
jgi:hypothetical protein